MTKSSTQILTWLDIVRGERWKAVSFCKFFCNFLLRLLEFFLLLFLSFDLHSGRSFVDWGFTLRLLGVVELNVVLKLLFGCLVVPYLKNSESKLTLSCCSLSFFHSAPMSFDKSVSGKSARSDFSYQGVLVAARAGDSCCKACTQLAAASTHCHSHLWRLAWPSYPCSTSQT